MARPVVTWLHVRIWDALKIPGIHHGLSMMLLAVQQGEKSGKACPAAWWDHMQETLAKEAEDG